MMNNCLDEICHCGILLKVGYIEWLAGVTFVASRWAQMDYSASIESVSLEVGKIM